MTISFSGLVPYSTNVRFLVIGSLLIQVVALYLHAYNLWQTMRSWKDSPSEKLARETAPTKS